MFYDEDECQEVRKELYYRRLDNLNRQCLQFIEKMLLCDKIQIQNIPFELRVFHKNFYVMAFRVSRNLSLDRLKKDLHLLYDDLQKDFKGKEDYESLLSFYLSWYDFPGDEKFEAFKKDISKKIL